MQQDEPRLTLSIGSFAPREGGSERQLRQALAVLAQRGFSCTVVTQALPNQPASDEVSGITVFRAGSSLLFNSCPWLGHAAYIPGALFRVLRSRPSVVVSTQLGSASVVARLSSALMHRPHILRLTGGGGGAVNSSEVERRSLSGRGRLLMKLAIGRSTTLVAPSDHLLTAAHEKLGLAPSRLRCIANGVPTVTGTPVRDLDALWYFRPGDSKNISAFLALVDELPQVMFHVIGREVDHRVLAKPNVVSHGWVENAEHLVARCRVLVNTSPSEGSPNLCLQAVAAGTPVAGFAVVGMRELRSTYPDPVRLVPMGDIAALGSTVLSLREQTFDSDSSVPTIEAAADQWAALFEEVTVSRDRSCLVQRVVRTLSYAAYIGIASQLPNRPQVFKRFRVLVLRAAGVDVHPTANINRKARISRRAVIGPHAGVGEGSSLSGEVHLGPHVTMGPGCTFITGDHPVPGDGEAFRDRSPTHAPIFVGEDVFFGARVIVLPGVEIGAGSAVGAGSVVVRSVDPGSIVVGNPAREVRRRALDPLA